ncbi:MAG TPA: hypothetical protein VHL80_17440 [Polyangia bacterium]|nr:hypothetical protein [Polyangia bacterium]
MRRPFTLAVLATLAACGSSPHTPPDGRPPDAGAPDGRDAALEGRAEVRGDAGDDGPADADAGAASDGYGSADGPCQPGVPRCHGDFGYQMCEQDGTWSASHSCAGYSMNGTTSYCAEIPMEGGGTWATCVDPACWYWLGRGALGGAEAVGVCEPDGTMQACLPGGTLAPAACAGVCTPVTTLDGRAVGYCAPECEDGARECLGGPFYRVCAGGRWGADVSSCEGACNPVAAGARPDIRCGGPCDPGTSRCRADDAAIEVCSAAGAWTLDRLCLLGRCRPAGPQAECETECAPGDHACAFDGAPSERVCDQQGLWMAETACPAGTSCRASGEVAIGCVACAGAGNAFGAADGRCAAGAGVETCGADNQWHPGASCDLDGGVCTALTRGASSIATCAAP